ncbi:MAG: DUF5908 family protein [Bacteroidia bacterium]
MPIEIKELIVRAFVGSEHLNMDGMGRGASAVPDNKDLRAVEEVIDQLKKNMLDQKER